MKFSVLLSILLSVSFILGVITIQNADAAVDSFLKIDSIPGESKDKAHPDEIEVLSWSWGIARQVESSSTGGSRTGAAANFGDLSYTKFVDKSTPLIMLKVANGEHFEVATLSIRQSGESTFDFFVITMKKVIVSSVSTGSSAGEDRLTENVSLNFSEVEIKYTETVEGKSTGDTKFKWDIAQNTEK